MWGGGGIVDNSGIFDDMKQNNTKTLETELHNLTQRHESSN